MKRILTFTSSLLISLKWLYSKPKVDLIIYNAKIYTVNDQFDIVEAIAVLDGKF
jgi:hypothetical protein